MSAPPTTPDHVLDFWFGEIAEDGSVSPERQQRWWKKDPDFDAEVRTRFGAAIDAAERGELDAWLAAPRSSLALVILLDQFTRNTRRDRPEMYDADAKAQSIVRAAIEAGHADRLRTMERYFLWMPLMHAESVDLQEECVERFEQLAAEAEPGAAKSAKAAVDYAIRHRDIVVRFGRFPHRNRILGRESTAEELAFLEQPGSSF